MQVKKGNILMDTSFNDQSHFRTDMLPVNNTESKCQCYADSQHRYTHAIFICDFENRSKSINCIAFFLISKLALFILLYTILMVRS